jgi:hypothetical protein
MIRITENVTNILKKFGKFFEINMADKNDMVVIICHFLLTGAEELTRQLKRELKFLATRAPDTLTLASAWPFLDLVSRKVEYWKTLLDDDKIKKCFKVPGACDEELLTVLRDKICQDFIIIRSTFELFFDVLKNIEMLLTDVLQDDESPEP